MSSGIAKPLVVAIDLGTDDSGYAFSFIDEYNNNPTSVHMRLYNSGTWMGYKQPTCVLCNPAGQFHSLGFDAEDKYFKLWEDNEHYNWYFFRKFTIMLSGKQVIKVNMTIEDVKGLKMPAMKVFSMAIRYLKDDLLNNFKSEKVEHLGENDIHWVLPVSATWTVSAKEFLREAATEAGIDGANLTIVLAPDAAAIYCEALPSDHLSCGGRFDDDKYMVIDLGDSQSVFTAHEKQPNGSIKEVHKVSVGPWGSTDVNEKFTQMIINIVGDRTFEKVYDDNPMILMDMHRYLEIKKYNTETDEKNRICIPVPLELHKIYKENTGQEVQEAVKQTRYKKVLYWRIANEMRLDAELFRSFFTNPISKITNHIENLCQKPGVTGTSTFLIIGKFSECPLVKDALIKAFPKAKVVIPEKPDVAVLKGAVVLGHRFGLTYDYNSQQPTNKDHSEVATTFAKEDQNDVASDDDAKGSTCSNSNAQDFRNDQITNMKYKSLSEMGEDNLSSDYMEMRVETQYKSAQGLETQLKHQMTLEAAKEDQNDVASDDDAKESTCSNSNAQDFRNDQITNMKYKGLSEMGEDNLSSDYMEMRVETQNKGAQGLETQLKNQMTLEAAKEDQNDVASDDDAKGSTCSNSNAQDFRNDQITNMKYKGLSEMGEDNLSSDYIEMRVETQDKGAQGLETQLKNQMTLEAAKEDQNDVASDDDAKESTCSNSNAQDFRNDQITNMKYKGLSEMGEDNLSSDYMEMRVETQNKGAQGLETQLKNQMTLEAAKEDQNDVASDDDAKGSTCSNSNAQDFRNDQITNMKYKGLSEMGEDNLSSDYIEMRVETQDKGAQGLETQLKNQMTLEAAKEDQNDVASDDDAKGSTCSNSNAQDFRNDQITNMKYKGLSEMGEDNLSSDYIEMRVETQDKGAQGLETQLKNQMTLEAAKEDQNDVASDDDAKGSTCSNSNAQDFRNDQITNMKYKGLSEMGEDNLSSDYIEMRVETQDKGAQGLETQLKNQMTLEAAKEDQNDVASDDDAKGSTCSNSNAQDFRNDQITNMKYKSLSEMGEDNLSSDYMEIRVETQDKTAQGLETQLKNQMTLEADNTRAPSDDELFMLSRQLNNFDREWWLLAKLLGLSDQQINEIEQTKGDRHIVRQYYTILTGWKRDNEGQEKGSVRYLLRQFNEAGIDQKVTNNVFGN